MYRLSLRFLAQKGGRVPNPGSSLLNPRSGRARLRAAMAAGEAAQQSFDAQALFSDIGGSGDGGVRRKGGALSSSSPSSSSAAAHKSRAQRKRHHVLRVGAAVAEQVKHMTDSEWESVPLEDKHAFTRFMAKMLKTTPTAATEQQRRRYFETTMVDPRDMDPNATVEDDLERLKLGLPIQLKNPQRSLGVSDAVYETADASLFDPGNVHKLENAMTHIKQVFADYVQKRRAGTSTEAERRQLANMTADLNVETQRHLASMFRHTEEKVRKFAMDEKVMQLRELERLKSLAAAAPAKGDARRRRRRLTTAQRKAKLTASISRAVGLDVAVVCSLVEELDAQERFMQFCEVFARLTVGKGFTHTSADEGLDAYADSLRRLYSVDAQQLSTLDVVQYMAAKEDAPPVEWARRWYERALMVPLQQTPEYRRLQEIQERDRAALQAKKMMIPQQQQQQQCEGEGEGEGATTTAPSPPAETTETALSVSAEAARAKQSKAVRLAEKMFLRPDDPRLESLHERRLRYLAYLQMERQIAQARENARFFAGVEGTAEAAECHDLYQQLLERKAQLPADANLYTDAEAAALFERIRGITEGVIADTLRRRREEEGRRLRSRAAARAQTAAALLRGVSGGDAAQELQALLREKKQRVADRLLGVVERDVRAEVEWLEAMAEAERPPLLPVPEGMSYVSAAEVHEWQSLRDADAEKSANPFTKKQRAFQPSLFGQTWRIPDKPTLFWGTGTAAVQQALQHAAEDADRRRRGEPLAPPYPCPENPWGWRLVKDILDD